MFFVGQSNVATTSREDTERSFQDPDQCKDRKGKGGPVDEAARGLVRCKVPLATEKTGKGLEIYQRLPRETKQ